MLALISREGFDIRVANLGGSLGAAAYFAEAISYSLGYVTRVRPATATATPPPPRARAPAHPWREVCACGRAMPREHLRSIPGDAPAVARPSCCRCKCNRSLASTVTAVGGAAVRGRRAGCPGAAATGPSVCSWQPSRRRLSNQEFDGVVVKARVRNFPEDCALLIEKLSG